MLFSSLDLFHRGRFICGGKYKVGKKVGAQGEGPSTELRAGRREEGEGNKKT
jgi:hypothetical protein